MRNVHDKCHGHQCCCCYCCNDNGNVVTSVTAIVNSNLDLDNACSNVRDKCNCNIVNACNIYNCNIVNECNICNCNIGNECTICNGNATNRSDLVRSANGCNRDILDAMGKCLLLPCATWPRSDAYVVRRDQVRVTMCDVVKICASWATQVVVVVAQSATVANTANASVTSTTFPHSASADANASDADNNAAT